MQYDKILLCSGFRTFQPTAVINITKTKRKETSINPPDVAGFERGKTITSKIRGGMARN